jgi:hypothetical protein
MGRDWQISGTEWELGRGRPVRGKGGRSGLVKNRWTAVATRPGRPPRSIKIDIAIEDERLVCVGVTCAAESPGLTSTLLREIPVARLMRESAKDILKFDIETLEDGSLALEPTRRPNQEVMKSLDHIVGPRRSPGRPRDGSLPEMVDRYKEEIAKGNRAPNVAIAAQMSYSVEYVRKRICYARKRGLLGRATPGKAGESEG